MGNRLSASTWRRVLIVVFVFGLGVAVASAFNLPGRYRTISVEGDRSVDGTTDGTESIDGEVDGTGETTGGTGTNAAGPTARRTVSTVERKFECAAGRNGGETDTGVTGNAVKVAANVVQDGPGASFLREAIIGIQAVIDEANVRGICGRKVLLEFRNDSWDRNRGLSYIENYIHGGAFALVVNPSSEGLDAAVRNGTIDEAGIPVIGSDGMLISQYRFLRDGNDLAKWVWPVAASTVSTMHIVAQHAASNGAKTFGLVYDSQYKFGVEGADAFEGAIRRMAEAGKDVRLVKRMPVEPGKTSYSTEAEQFNQECGGQEPKCDLVAMLLDPSTAITWIKAGGTFGSQITAGPQTLFNRAFAVNCVDERKKLGKGCDLMVWTGYNPPVGALASQPDVAKFVADVESRNAKADVQNSFTQGAYLGAKVFVHALEEVGPNLTRANLKAVLDAMTYTSDLTNQLVWNDGQHFANTRMQAFRIGYSQDKGFVGWQPASPWIEDGWVGQL